MKTILLTVAALICVTTAANASESCRPGFCYEIISGSKYCPRTVVFTMNPSTHDGDFSVDLPINDRLDTGISSSFGTNFYTSSNLDQARFMFALSPDLSKVQIKKNPQRKGQEYDLLYVDCLFGKM